MDLTDINHTLDALVPAMRTGFIVKTDRGNFLMKPSYGLDSAIAQVRATLENCKRAWVGRTREQALQQFETYVEQMTTMPGRDPALQRAHLRGYVEALFYAGIINNPEFQIYTKAIDDVEVD